MAYISMMDYDNAPEEARAAHDAHAKIGRITNMKRTLLNSVPAFHALMEWYTLRDEAVARKVGCARTVTLRPGISPAKDGELRWRRC